MEPDPPCPLSAGTRVRVLNRRDVPPAFALALGVVESSIQTGFGCLYQVRLLDRPLLPEVVQLHAEQIEALSATRAT